MPDGVMETCSEPRAKAAEAQPGPSTTNVEWGWWKRKEKDQEEISFPIVPPSPGKANRSADTSTPDTSDISFMDIMPPLPKRAKKEKKRGISNNHQRELVPGKAKQGLKNKGKKDVKQRKRKGKARKDL